MRMTTLVASIGIVSVLAAGITAGLIFARDQAPPASVPEIVVAVADSESISRAGPATALEPPLVAAPEPEPERSPAAALEPGPEAIPETQMEGPSEGDYSGLEGDSPGTVYTWNDGDRTLRAVLQTAPVAQETETTANTSEDHTIKETDVETIGRKRSEYSTDAQPVFRPESGGGKMTLPGGIILALDPEWDREEVERFFSRHGIALDRASELDFLTNGFFVETEAGFPSLELANTLAEQDGVLLSSPNWSREVELN